MYFVDEYELMLLLITDNKLELKKRILFHLFSYYNDINSNIIQLPKYTNSRQSFTNPYRNTEKYFPIYIEKNDHLVLMTKLHGSRRAIIKNLMIYY